MNDYVPLRRLVICLDGKRVPLNREERSDMKGDIPYWGAGGVVDHVNKSLFDETLVLLGEDGAPFFDPGRDVSYLVDGPVWVNNHIHVLRPVSVEPRFLVYSLNVVDYSNYISGSTRDKLTQEDMREIPVPSPPIEEQRRIADFLDAETGRIDAMIQRRIRQKKLIEQRLLSRAYYAIRGETESGPRVDSGLSWLGTIPASWPVLSVASQFDIRLGKMLNAERAAHGNLRPYLRNSNVQWDRIDTEDLLEMDFPTAEKDRYRVLRGDLLICEGGQPGRAAIWDGRIEEIYYQKALHRARTRGRSRPRWMYYCLLSATALDVFSVEGNVSTISHLTGEQLAKHHFPFPEPETQDRIIANLDETTRRENQLAEALDRQIDLLVERRRALITAAVNAQVTGASSVSS